MCPLGVEWSYLVLALAFVILHAYGSAIKHERLKNFASVGAGVVILTVFWTH